jgi:ElaB protein
MGATFENNHSGDGTQAQDSESGQFHDLFDSVEDLIKRVAEIDSPEVQKIRAKARVALMVAKSAVHDSATHVGRQARRAAGTTDEYLREYPWYALGLVTLVGFGAGLLVSRARD